ncbi:hypothetical protein [Caballeronia concitans]|nr:hypothetical protein [Caballeronia concitans]
MSTGDKAVDPGEADQAAVANAALKPSAAISGSVALNPFFGSAFAYLTNQ